MPGITFNGKSAMDMRCKKCGKPVATQEGNTITMNDIVNINNVVWHTECYEKK